MNGRPHTNLSEEMVVTFNFLIFLLFLYYLQQLSYYTTNTTFIILCDTVL
jgi:hypothetical protein